MSEVYALGDGRVLCVLVQAEEGGRKAARERAGGSLRRPESFVADAGDVGGVRFVPVFTDPDLARDNLLGRGLAELGLGVEGPLDEEQRGRLFGNCLIGGVAFFAVDPEPEAVWMDVYPLEELERVAQGTLEGA